VVASYPLFELLAKSTQMFIPFIDTLLLVIFIPIAGYKILRFGKKFWELASRSPTPDLREALERAWIKS